MRTSDVSSARRGLGLLLAVLLAAAAPVVAQPKAARQAVITLDKGGDIVIELFPADAPRHVKNFAELAGQGFYDGLRFHRVEPWVVQAGDPQSKTLPMDHPRMGTGGPGYAVKAEFNRRPHERGAVGMARGGDPDSAGSQFYIVLKPARHLDGQYTVFGHVIRGLEVVDGLRRGDRIKSVKVTP